MTLWPIAVAVLLIFLFIAAMVIKGRDTWGDAIRKIWQGLR